MGKSKGARITITLECLDSSLNEVSRRKNGVFRYTTSKNRRNSVGRLELKKFCPISNRHKIFKEIK